MTVPPRSLKELFLAVLEVAPADRVVWLERECSGDARLRQQLNLMLEAHDAPHSLLDQPAMAEPGATIDQPFAERPGAQIGPYKLLQQIGEGGMGVVYMAEQEQPVRRRVAFKIIKPGMDTRQVIARFEAERQALSLMDHPNIAKVLDAGTTESGRPYFVMELVKGQPITQYCDEHHLTPRQRLELLLPVCQAIQHAHQKGIIHRDIKPTNVLVAEYDQKAVPKVIDFGVAKAISRSLTEKTMFTGLGQIVGTLEYMSPEQAKVNQLDIDTRSDIYSLGVLLYELLTGSTPFDKTRLRSAAFDEMLRIIREEEPEKPSTRLSSADTLPSIAANRNMEPARLGRTIRGELDWIVMKALEKDRSRRYETANGFAADVQRYLSDEPVQACPPSAGYRLRKLVRRHKGPVLAASLVVLALVGGIIGTTWGLIRATDAQAVAVKEAKQKADALTAKDAALQAETQAKETLRRDSYFHKISLAHRDLSADNLGRALKLLDECPEDLRQWEWYYLRRLCAVEPLVLRNNTEVIGVAFSRDGELLASAGEDGFVKIWNSRTGKVIQTFPAHTTAPTDSVVCVAFHPDGYLASVGSDKIVKVWDLKTEKELFAAKCKVVRKYGAAYAAAFSPDGQLLAAATDAAVLVWDWKNHRVLHNLHPHPFNSIAVAFSGDGRLATGVLGEGLKLWDSKTGGLLRAIPGPGHRHPISALAFSPSGERLASASFDRTVKVWDTATDKQLPTLDLHTGNVECVAFSPDSRRIASGGEDLTVRIWDSATGQEVLGLRGHAGRCGCVAFSPDGRLASASIDRTIRIWDATPLRGNEEREVLTFQEHNDEIRSVAFSPDGQRIASASQDGPVKVWDSATGKMNFTFSDYTRIVFGLAWHPLGGQRIATVGFDGRRNSVKVLDAQTGLEVFALPAGEAYHTVAISPDDRYLVTGSSNGVLQVWDAGNGQPVKTLGTHDLEIRGVVFSQDGQHLVSASGDGKVKLWDATRLDRQQVPRHTLSTRVPGPSLNVAFSPDGRRLATGGEHNTIIIWDVESGRELDTLWGHTGEVYAVEFSRDGQWLASAGGDCTVKIWDGNSGELVGGFRGHRGLIGSLSFSPDGRRLVTGSRDKTVKVWDMTQLERAPDR
jgi:WD40 repeat protein/serine/threonine protein kinase